MHVTIYGSGYVGLVTGACLAEVGNHVLCVDIDATKVHQLQQGAVPIHEPGLDAILESTRRTGHLTFTTDVAEGVHHGTVQMIAVGTPPEEDGSADLRHVLAVARSIGEHISDYRLVLTKSTVPVGTAGKVREAIRQALAARAAVIEFDVASNPEFLKEGGAIEDFRRPDRIVVGTDTTRAAELLRELYAPFNRNRDRLLAMDIRSAELTKYAANAMLATKISFMNELANIAERVGADIEQVRIGMGSDPRIGYYFIYPGCGYGGSCFPKDVRALSRTAAVHGYTADLLNSVESINNRQKHVLFEKVKLHFAGKLVHRTFALWGLAFKPNTDDMREAPSRPLMEGLWEAGARIRAYDPVAMATARRLYGDRADLALCDSPIEAARGADGLIIATEWNIFRSPSFAQLRAALKAPLIFDGRNMYEPAYLQREGFTYYAVGRGQSLPPIGADNRPTRPVLRETDAG